MAHTVMATICAAGKMLELCVSVSRQYEAQQGL